MSETGQGIQKAGAPVAPASEPKRPAVTKITELRDGSAMFQSRGFAHVKVTKDGEAGVLEIPIRSTGVAEVLEGLRAQAPQPPVKPVLVTHGSPVGQKMKMAPGQKQWVRMPDFGDTDYRKAEEKYQEQATLNVILQGIDVPFTREDGSAIESADEKIQVLRRLGLSMPQFTKLANDIRDLTTLTDKDKEDFFGDVSAGAETETD